MSRIEEVAGKVEDLPSAIEYWQVVGRYTKGSGAWFAAGMHRHRIDAEDSALNFGYAEAKLVRILLPA